MKMSQGSFNFEAVQFLLCLKNTDHFSSFILLLCKVLPTESHIISQVYPDEELSFPSIRRANLILQK